MRAFRGVALMMAIGMACAAVPASAQFFLKSRDFSGAPVKGDEPGIAQPMPGATASELRAGIVWNMRAALNVAALQCQFEPSLLTVPNYNAVLADHKDELKNSFDTLTRYFSRTSKTKKEGQSKLDQFGTRTYASFTTVGAQYSFCQTASAIGRDAIFQPRGSFSDIAEGRMRELRNSLSASWGEQGIAHFAYDTTVLPRFDPICWRRGSWDARKCGAMNWPAGPGYAAR